LDFFLLGTAMGLFSLHYGFVKSPFAALRCVLRHCSVMTWLRADSSRLARGAIGAFFFAVNITIARRLFPFFDIIYKPATNLRG
jgi:hypothetical protein